MAVIKNVNISLDVQQKLKHKISQGRCVNLHMGMCCAPTDAHLCHWSLLILRSSMTGSKIVNITPQNVCISIGKTTIVNCVKNQESMGTSKCDYFLRKY